MLVTAKGHPPGIVFAPVALAIWLLGHALLWLIRRMAIRGRSRATKIQAAHDKWPPTLIVLAVSCGVVFIFGSFALVLKILFDRDWPPGVSMLLAVWVTSSVCFFGILLRRNWSRIIAGAGLLAVAVILLYEMIASSVRGYANSTTELLTGSAIFVALLLIGQHVVRSRRIKDFFARR